MLVWTQSKLFPGVLYAVIVVIVVIINGTKQSKHLIRRPSSRTIDDLTAIYTAARKLCEFGKRRLSKTV